MTEDDLREIIESAGGSQVKFHSQQFDCGTKMGFGVEFSKGGQKHRYAVRSYDGSMPDALTVLASWARERLA